MGIMGGIVKRSLAMVSPEHNEAIAKACGLDAASRCEAHVFCME
jgi:hypothetical protein